MLNIETITIKQAILRIRTLKLYVERLSPIKLLSTVITILLLSNIIACSGNSINNDIVIVVDPSPRVGIWKSQGSGLIVELDEVNAEVFEISAISCLRVFSGAQTDLKKLLVDSLTVNQDDKLVAPLLAANETILFDRISTSPTLCNNGGTEFTADPIVNFEVFWNTFSEHYTYFEQRNIDWQQVHDDYITQVTTNSTELELMEIFSEILTPFKDAHIAVESPNFTFDGTDAVVFNEYFPRASDVRAIETIQSTYLNDDYKVDAENLVYWGSIDDNIGYVNFRKFGGFAGSSQNPLDHDSKFDEILFEIVQDFSNKSAIVIDVRNNSGGGDGRVQRLASVFNDTEVLFYREKTRHEGTFTDDISFTSQPDESLRFAGNVVVLTSPISVSSAEQLAMNVMVLPQAVLIGESTYGAFSQLGRTLPNGWSLKLTNQVVTAADGNDYEVNGIPPTIYSESFTTSDLETGVDSTLNVAIDWIGNQ